MRNPHGHAVMASDAGTVERDTFGCAHCQRIVHVEPRQAPEDLGGLCKVCMHLICPRCVGSACTPFLARLDAQERRQAALRSYGLG